jgi:hypothetical protein
MDIYNENDDTCGGACSIWRFYDFGGAVHGDTDPEVLLTKMIRNLHNYTSTDYDGDKGDLHGWATAIQEEHGFNAGTDLFTVVLTSTQISKKGMDKLITSGPFTSFTSLRPKHPEGDLIFYLVTAGQFFDHVRKVFKPVPVVPPVTNTKLIKKARPAAKKPR